MRSATAPIPAPGTRSVSAGVVDACQHLPAPVVRNALSARVQQDKVADFRR